MSEENINKLHELVNPIQWDTYKDSKQQYVNSKGCPYRYYAPTLKRGYKLSELRQKAKDLGIKKYYLMNRAELIKNMGCSINDTCVQHNAPERVSVKLATDGSGSKAKDT